MHLVPFNILYTLISYLSKHTHITCIIHDLGILGVTQRIQIIPCKMISCLWLVHVFGQSNRDCSKLPLN